MGTYTTDLETMSKDIEEIKEALKNKKEIHDVEFVNFDPSGNSIVRSVYTDGTFGSEFIIKRGERGYTGFSINDEIPVENVPYGTIMEYNGGELPSGWMFTTGGYISSKRYPQMNGILNIEINYKITPILTLETSSLNKWNFNINFNVKYKKSLFNDNIYKKTDNTFNKFNKFEINTVKNSKNVCPFNFYFKKASELANSIFKKDIFQTTSVDYYYKTLGEQPEFIFAYPSKTTFSSSSVSYITYDGFGILKDEEIYIEKISRSNDEKINEPDLYLKEGNNYFLLDDLFLGFISLNANNSMGRSADPEKEPGRYFFRNYKDNINWILNIEYLDSNTGEYILASKLRSKEDFVIKGEYGFSKIFSQLPSKCDGYRLSFDLESEYNVEQIKRGLSKLIHFGELKFYFFDKNTFSYSYKLPEMKNDQGFYKIIYVGQPHNIKEPLIIEVNQNLDQRFFTWSNEIIEPQESSVSIDSTIIEGITFPTFELDVIFTNRIESSQYPFRSTTWTLRMSETFDWNLSLDYNISIKYNFKIYDSSTKNEVMNASSKFFNKDTMGQSFDVDLPTLTNPFEVSLKSIVVMLSPK